MHPLVRAGGWLVADLFSTLVFVAVYAATQSIYVATGLAILLGLGRIAHLKLSGALIDSMQWFSIFLVVVFGGASLLTRNPIFIMLKPTLIYVAIGAVMLRPGWMKRYMPPIALSQGADVVVVFGYVWATLMFATGGANIAVALIANPTTWAWYLGIFPVASKIALVIAQYFITKRIIRRRIRALNISA